MQIKCETFASQILLRIDNITALACINKTGSLRSKYLNEITKEIWSWCENKSLWGFAENVASKDNPAGYGSRISNIDTEWELSHYAYYLIIQTLGEPSIDLFASRTNRKCAVSFAINALTISWKNFFWYAFPPFSLISKILKKIREEKSKGILVIPDWSSQPWHPEFHNLCISKLVILPPHPYLLLSRCRKLIHPLHNKLTLIAGVVSG